MLIDRRRNAADTREAILDAARVAFTRHGFDQIGIREITRSAGVNGSLVNRYFGSKESLFAEAMSLGLGFDKNIDFTWPQAAGPLAAFVLDKDGVDGDVFDPILTLIRSASNVDAQLVLRDYLSREAIDPLAILVGGEQARERAGLIVAFLIGVVMLRAVIKAETLAEARRTDLADLIERFVMMIAA